MEKQMFENEEAEKSNLYGYGQGFFYRTVFSQWEILKKHFPELDSLNLDYWASVDAGEIRLLRNEENNPVGSWYVFPNWRKHPEVFGRFYPDAVNKIFSVLPSVRFNSGYKIDGNHLRQTDEFKEFFIYLCKVQGNPDFLIIGAQLGYVWANKSFRRAKVLFRPGELGLGVFAARSILLTHPERQTRTDDLGMICGGDEYSGEGSSDFSSVPKLYKKYSDSKFGANSKSFFAGFMGTVTAFYPV
ncbi:MAG: hypothetical protein WCT18_04285 [Patescibacteria group bacterium]